MGQQTLGHRPALALAAHPIGDRHANAIQRHPIEHVPPVDRDDWQNLNAGRMHVDQQEGDPGLALRLVRCAGQTEHPVRLVRAAGPDLFAVDDIGLAVQDRAGAQRGQVRPCAGLGIALTPAFAVVDDVRQEPLLLLGRPVGEQDRRQHAHPHAANLRRQVCLRCLPFPDVALGWGPARPTERRRPPVGGPAALKHGAMPALFVPQAAIVAFPTGEGPVYQGANFLAECEVCVGQAEVHRQAPTVYCTVRQ